MTEWLNVSDITPRIVYTATASQTAFTVPFVFFENSDLKVYQNAALLTLDTDYTVTGAEEDGGGTVTLVTGATLADEIMIARDVPIEQTTHIPPSGPLDVPAINIQFSKFVAMIQQIVNFLSRAVHFPDNDSTTSGELAAPATRANKILGFDSDGAIIYATGPTFVNDTATAAATVDSLGTAQVTTFGVSVNAVFTGGYASAGDGGGAVYKRGAGAGSWTDGGGTTFSLDVSGRSVSIRAFGAGHGGDDTTKFNAAFAAAPVVVIPPGTYALTGDVQIPSNRHIWVQKGATIVNTGGRFTGHVPGGGNITFQIDGVMSFPATADGAALGDWDARALIEIGGSFASAARNIRIFGTGEVFSDYVAGANPPSAFTNQAVQLNRNAIGLWAVNDSEVSGLYVHDIHGIGIYNASQGGVNVKFLYNHVQDVGFNGLNFNGLGNCYNYVIAGNFVRNCWQAIEASVGTIDGNTILFATTGITTGAGLGASPLRVTNNVIDFATTAIEVAYAPTTVSDVVISGNQLHGALGGGINVDNIESGIISNNMIYTWAFSSSGAAINLGSLTGHLYVNGNVLRAATNFSTGNIVNNGTGNTIGTNPVF